MNKRFPLSLAIISINTINFLTDDDAYSDFVIQLTGKKYYL